MCDQEMCVGCGKLKGGKSLPEPTPPSPKRTLPGDRRDIDQSLVDLKSAVAQKISDCALWLRQARTESEVLQVIEAAQALLNISKEF